MAKHEKVSVDEIREKRLAAEQQQAVQAQTQIQPEQTEQSQSPVQAQAQTTQPPQNGAGGTDTQLSGSGGTLSGGITGTSTPLTEVIPVAVPVVPDLESMLAAMSPDQIARLRVIAAAKGVAVPSGQSSGSGTRHADGSMDVTVHLEPEVVEQLMNWSEPGGMTVTEAAQKYISEALTAFLYGDWNPTPETATIPVVAATK